MSIDGGVIEITFFFVNNEAGKRKKVILVLRLFQFNKSFSFLFNFVCFADCFSTCMLTVLAAKISQYLTRL